MTSLIPTPQVSLVNDRPAVTSFDVATHFGKRHCDVLRDVRKIMEAIPDDLRERNFALTFRTVAGPNNSSRQEEYFVIFQDGFILLVMGYTGKKAMQIKIAYIMAFNAMAAKLGESPKPHPLPLPPQVLPSSFITPDQQCTLQAIVKAKVGQMPTTQQGKAAYAQIWTRFKNHFRVAKYDQLPQERMSEAVAYLTAMDVKQKRRCQGQALPLIQTSCRKLANYAKPFLLSSRKCTTGVWISAAGFRT